jgi:hypothetical protein
MAKCILEWQPILMYLGYYIPLAVDKCKHSRAQKVQGVTNITQRDKQWSDSASIFQEDAVTKIIGDIWYN